MAAEKLSWNVQPSLTAQRSNNPIRQIVDKIKKPNMPEKPLIPLSLGENPLRDCSLLATTEMKTIVTSCVVCAVQATQLFLETSWPLMCSR